MNIYKKDAVYQLHYRPDAAAFGYSEGEVAERRLLETIESLSDRSTFSEGLVEGIDDWSTRYHFSRSRHCLLRPLDILPGERVLELGCGAGAITRYLGETGAEVVAVEGSLARARVTAARCFDLPNVTVIADDLQKVEVEGLFDWVTLIGVLEYAGAYSDAADPYQAYLAAAIRHLRPGGRLVVAIENQLGLKYFNGCGEDHLGRAFAGVQDLYQEKGGVRTFGRKALSAVFDHAGLTAQTWLYPYPDYKIPAVVLTDAALNHPGFDAADLLLRSFSEDYAGHMLRAFDEALVNRVLAENGLLGDLSNSFLVVASRPPERGLPQPWRPGALAWTWSVHRQPGFCTETVFKALEGQTIRVYKHRLLSHLQNRLPFLDGQGSISLEVTDSDYFPGRQQAWDVVRAHVMQGTPDALVEALKPWAQAMLALASPGEDAEEEGGKPLRNYLLPGDRIDHAPFNLLVDDLGQSSLIDQEWVSSRPIPAGWVLTRGVLHALQAGVAPPDSLDSLEQVVVALAQACGFDANTQDVGIWFELEASFSRTLAPKRTNHRLNSATQSPAQPFIEMVQRLRQDVAELQGRAGGLQHQLTEAQEQLAEIRGYLATKEQENIESLTRIDQYQVRIQELEERELQMLRSRSWRWSEWLRKVRRRVRL